MMSIKIGQLLIALVLTVCCQQAHSQDSTDSAEPDADAEMMADDALQAAVVAPAAQPEKAAQIRASLQRSEAARRRGDIRAQIAELRRAHGLAEGRNSSIVELLASALMLSGDMDEARRLREAIIATDIDPGAKVAHLSTLVLYATQMADSGRAARWLESAEAIARNIGDNDNGRRAQTHLHKARAALLFAQGKFKEAEAEGRLVALSMRRIIQAKGDKASAQDRYLRNLFDGRLALALVNQGKIAESEWIYRDILDRSIQETGAHSVPTANFAKDLANTQLRQGRHEEALRHATVALATLEQHKIKESAASMRGVLLQIGWAQVMAGRFEPALAAFERRARSWVNGESGGSVVWGYAMIRAGRAEAALPMLRAHYDASLRRSPTSYTTRERAGMYAHALLRSGQAAEAAKLFATAMPGLVRSRQSRRVADRADILFETISNWIIEGYLESLSRDAESGDARAIAEMFRLADVARGSSVQRALALASTRAKIDDPELAGIVRQEQDRGNRQTALGRIVEDLLARPREKQPLQVIADIRRDIEAAAAGRDKLRREIATRFPKYSQLIEPSPTTTANLVKLLKPGEVMLSTYTAPDRTYVWAVPKSGAIRFARSSLGTNESMAAVKKLRVALDVGAVPLSAFPAFDAAAAYSLYEQLLKPVESAWSNADSLIVVAHGALGQLPFALLPTAAAANVHSMSFEGYRKVPWLIRRIAISQLPSVSALAALRAGSGSAVAAGRAFAGFGDPQFGGRASASSGAMRGLALRNLQVAAGGTQANPPSGSSSGFGRLPQLPDTALELQEISAVLKAGGADVMLGLQASETNVKQSRLDQYRVLMFATHGLVPGDLDGLTQPALALSNPELTGEKDADGLLTLDEVLGLKLNADWVVLSACNTATGDGAGNEAVSGLGRAFFYAGARSLLVSNWPVETVSARLITTDLFRRQSVNPALSRGEALRQTMLNMIDRGEAKDASGRVSYTYAHPMFWAPFSLVGDGGGR